MMIGLLVGVGVLGAIVLVTVLTVVVIKNKGGNSAEHDQRTARAEGTVLDARSHRHNVLETGFVKYEALVRFAAPGEHSVETWVPSYLPTKGWQIPGQRVLIEYNPADPHDAHVDRAL